LDLGIDQIALVQELIPARNGHITRVETLGGKFLYAIDIRTTGENFNLCPAEICQIEGVAAFLEGSPTKGPEVKLQVQPATPPRSLIDAVEKIVAVGGIDVGGVEYIIDERDGRAAFYDINALSNFVADASNVVGFDPWLDFVDYLEDRMGTGNREQGTEAARSELHAANGSQFPVPGSRRSTRTKVGA